MMGTDRFRTRNSIVSIGDLGGGELSTLLNAKEPECRPGSQLRIVSEQ